MFFRKSSKASSPSPLQIIFIPSSFIVSGKKVQWGPPKIEMKLWFFFSSLFKFMNGLWAPVTRLYATISGRNSLAFSITDERWIVATSTSYPVFLAIAER